MYALVLVRPYPSQKRPPWKHGWTQARDLQPSPQRHESLPVGYLHTPNVIPFFHPRSQEESFRGPHFTIQFERLADHGHFPTRAHRFRSVHRVRTAIFGWSSANLCDGPGGGRAKRLQPTPFFLSHQRIDLSTVCLRSFFLPMQRAYARLRGNESSWLGPAKLKRPTAQPLPAPASA